MSNFWLDSFPAALPGSTVPGQGGYGTDALTARNPLDAKRMAAGFAPGASYPDGYLGNITDRREDRVLGALQHQNTRSYQRGVHKGERTDPGSYAWTQEVNPDAGLARQAAAVAADIEGGVVLMTKRYAPAGDPVEMVAHDARISTLPMRERDEALRQAGGDPAKNPVQVVDPSRRAQMAKHLPRWSGAFQA